MKILKMFVSIVIIVLISGCAPLVLNIKDPSSIEVVRLNVDKIGVVSNAKIEPWRNSPYSSDPNPLSQNVQLQFHEAIKRNAGNALIVAGNSTNKTAIIQIDRAVVTMTNQGIKSVAFIGLFFVGMEEEYTATIEGVIEIEDDQKQVVDKADIRINTTIKGRNATREQIEEGASNAINEALISLQKEIVGKSKRYLHKYLL